MAGMKATSEPATSLHSIGSIRTVAKTLLQIHDRTTEQL
jgi:hypothetical protein